MILAHRIRLDPTPQQERYFVKACGAARFAFNWGLAEWEKAYKIEGKKPDGRMIRNRFNAIRRAEFPWTYDVHKDCTMVPFSDLQAAFSNFFQRTRLGQYPLGYPNFKKKGRCNEGFYIAGEDLQPDGRRVRLPKIGWIKTREALRFEGRVISGRVTHRNGQWYLSVQVDVGVSYQRERTGDGVVGVDLGIRNSATLSTGEVIQGPKALKRGRKKLIRLSRRFSRKEKGSENQKKAQLQLSRYHLKIANVRQDHVHKVTTYLCKNHAAVGIEDLVVKNMVRNHCLARAISDEAWGSFRYQMGYKGPLYGTEIVVHDRWFPSSKTCSGCRTEKAELELSERTFRCEVCGLVIDRDLNAALNLEPVLVPGGYRGRNAWGEEGSGREKRPTKPTSKNQESGE
jgi:putative transposase